METINQLPEKKMCGKHFDFGTHKYISKPWYKSLWDTLTFYHIFDSFENFERENYEMECSVCGDRINVSE